MDVSTPLFQASGSITQWVQAHATTLALYLPLGLVAGLVLRAVRDTLQVVLGVLMAAGFTLHLLGLVNLNEPITRFVVQPLLELQQQPEWLLSLPVTLQSHGLMGMCLITGMMLGMGREQEDTHHSW